MIDSTTILQSTPDSSGPYVVQAIVIGVTDHVVELRYRINDASIFIPLVMRADGERFQAAIPGSAPGTAIAYYVTVVRDGIRVATDPPEGAAFPYTLAISAQ